MKAYAEKLMIRTHAAVKKYQLAQESNKNQPISPAEHALWQVSYRYK